MAPSGRINTGDQWVRQPLLLDFYRSAGTHPFADPKPPRKLMEIANSVEPVQGCLIHIEEINWPFLCEFKGTPAEYSAGLKLAIESGWLWMHESGTYVKFTSEDAALFA